VPGLALSAKRDILQANYPGVLVCSAAEVPTHPDVDLVVIASPNESHFPLAATPLRAGKDVVVDKPFTVTLPKLVLSWRSQRNTTDFFCLPYPKRSSPVA
jgi:hypothetical protein